MIFDPAGFTQLGQVARNSWLCHIERVRELAYTQFIFLVQEQQAAQANVVGE